VIYASLKSVHQALLLGNSESSQRNLTLEIALEGIVLCKHFVVNFVNSCLLFKLILRDIVYSEVIPIYFDVGHHNMLCGIGTVNSGENRRREFFVDLSIGRKVAFTPLLMRFSQYEEPSNTKDNFKQYEDHTKCVGTVCTSFLVSRDINENWETTNFTNSNNRKCGNDGKPRIQGDSYWFNKFLDEDGMIFLIDFMFKETWYHSVFRFKCDIIELVSLLLCWR